MVIVSSAEVAGRDHPRPSRAARSRLRAVKPSSLAANAELLDQRAVARLVLALDVVEERAALGDHLQEATPGMVVLGVGLEVLGQVVDAFGQDCDLDLGRPGVAGLMPMFLDERGLALRRDRHRASFLVGVRRRPARGPSASESGRAGMSSSAVARNASRREIPARDEASIHESRRKTSGMWRQTNLGHSADYLTPNEDLEVDSESKVFGG